MQGQVIRTWKGSFTHLTLKRPVSRVFAIMSRQFIGSGEFPSAILPGALIRFLTCVRSQVGLQMRRFRVRFITSNVWTRVSRQSFTSPCSPSASTSARTFTIFFSGIFDGWSPKGWMSTLVAETTFTAATVTWSASRFIQ